MRLCIVDVDDLPDDVDDRLRRAGAAEVLTAKVDVEGASAMGSLAGNLRRGFGEIAFLMNNAACGGGGRSFEDPEGWRRILNVNLGGACSTVRRRSCRA
jgi:NAD(P)-dependent dehydrogenase (short-subunit alcohol dehydrogenase family)